MKIFSKYFVDYGGLRGVIGWNPMKRGGGLGLFLSFNVSEISNSKRYISLDAQVALAGAQSVVWGPHVIHFLPQVPSGSGQCHPCSTTNFSNVAALQLTPAHPGTLMWVSERTG